ncbi:MAG TPA: YIP1 family protein [Gemmatimonadaceae bacterium]|nr:YIP1 family protein [Gemmatimonadaceae bacterium]
MSTPATAAAPKPVSAWEDFVDIFVSPSQVFARRQNSGFLLPLVVLTVVMLVLYIGTRSLFQPIMDAEFSRQVAAAMKANPQASAAGMQTMRKYMDIFGILGVLVGTPIRLLVTGLVLWLVGKMFDSRQSIGAAMMVSSFAFFPLIIQWVVYALQAAVMDPAKLTSLSGISVSLARFIDPDTGSKIMLALAGRVDLFLIWITVLLAIGLAITGKISKSRAGIAAAIVWILGVLPALLGALRAAA